MKSSLLIFILGMLAHFLTANAMQTQPSQQKLEVQGELKLGETQTRTLASDETHVWSVALDKGQYVVVEVEQKDIDIMVRIIDPTGIQRKEIDSPTGTKGTESAIWITNMAGVWKLEIAPLETNQPGGYEIKWVTLRDVTERDRKIAESDSLGDLAEAHYGKGEYVKSEPLFQQSLAIREKVFGYDHDKVATSIHNLAVLYMTQGKYSEAAPYFKQSLTIYEKLLGPDHSFVATNLNNLAIIYRAQGKYAEAETLLSRSLAIFEKSLGPNHPDVATSLDNLAVVYDDHGKYIEAEALHKRALNIRKKVLNPTHPDIAYSLKYLADFYYKQGNYTEAESLYRQSVNIDEKALGSDHPNIALNLTDLAQLLQKSGKYTEAVSLIKRALTLSEKALGTEHPNVAICLNQLGNLYYTQSKYAEAESLHRRALMIREKVYGHQHPRVANIIINLARDIFYKSEEELQVALALIDQAIDILDANFVFPESKLEAYALRAQLLHQKKKIDAALSDLAEALHFVEKLRPQISESEEIRAIFFEGYYEHFNRMIAWLLEAGQIEKALKYAERGRARVLLDQFAANDIDLRSSIPVDIRAPLEKRETNAKARLAEYQQRINRLRSRKDLSNEEKTKQIAALQDSLRIADRDYQEVYEEIKNASPLWRNLITSSGQPVSLANIQRELVPPNGLMLLYQIGKEGSHLFVISPGEQKPEAISLQVTDKDTSILQVKGGPLKSTDLQKILADSSAGLLRYLKMNSDLLKSGQEKLATTKLQALWNVLIPSSIWPKVKACAEVIIIPDGLLHQLPFEALVVQGGKTPADTRYWLDDGPVIRYAPSATILYSLEKRQMEKSPAQPSILSLSDPIFDLEAVGKEMQKQIASRGATPQDSTTTKSSGLVETLLAETRGKEREFAGPLPRLLGTDTETNYIRQYFGAKNVKALQQLQADEPHLRANLQGKRYVHLATHGLVELQQSSLSNALALTPPPKDTVNSENDGFLKLYEIYELKLNNCELAVLSACETHFGRLFEGEGVFALSRGFLAAGAARVVASHWQVQDNSTAELVGAFFRSVANAEKNGKPVDYAQALRDAKLKLRRDKNRRQWAVPYFWAPFIITGKR